MLGDFGVERPQVEESFGYFGTTVRVNPDISDLAVIELFRTIGEGEDPSSTTTRIAATLVHPDDIGSFLATAVAKRQTIEDLVNIGLKLLEALTARPTVLPSDSSDGQSSTAPSSGGDSFSQALRVLDGRPDLQVAVVRAKAS